MGNKLDGQEDAKQIVKRVYENIEKGDFSPKEQHQVADLISVFKKHGDLESFDTKALKELDHIVKSLSGKSDKNILMDEEVNDLFLSVIRQKKGHTPNK